MRGKFLTLTLVLVLLTTSCVRISPTSEAPPVKPWTEDTNIPTTAPTVEKTVTTFPTVTVTPLPQTEESSKLENDKGSKEEKTSFFEEAAISKATGSVEYMMVDPTIRYVVWHQNYGSSYVPVYEAGNVIDELIMEFFPNDFGLFKKVQRCECSPTDPLYPYCVGDGGDSVGPTQIHKTHHGLYEELGYTGPNGEPVSCASKDVLRTDLRKNFECAYVVWLRSDKTFRPWSCYYIVTGLPVPWHDNSEEETQ